MAVVNGAQPPADPAFADLARRLREVAARHAPPLLVKADGPADTSWRWIVLSFPSRCDTSAALAWESDTSATT